MLTASGGPFRGRTATELDDVTPADALAHPTWNMGAKITIDSSTLMNKGLEVIEAHELFGVDFDQIDVVVHPQSVVHSMVEFVDGATIAQLSMPDMRLPIGLALGAPEPAARGLRRDRLDDARDASRSRSPDRDDVPVPRPRLRRRDGPAAPRRRCSQRANEVAVEAFLAGRIALVADRGQSSRKCSSAGTGNADEVADVLDADRGRARARRRPP